MSQVIDQVFYWMIAPAKIPNALALAIVLLLFRAAFFGFASKDHKHDK